MTMIVQTYYSQYLPKGQPGQIARPEVNFEIDNRYNAGAALLPGYGVVKDATTGLLREPASQAEQSFVLGVIGLMQNEVNQAVTNTSGNNQSQEAYASGDVVNLIKVGFVYVTAGGTVKKDQPAYFNYTTNKWVTLTDTDPRSNAMYFDQDGVDGDIVAIRLSGRISDVTAV